jgi:hypothetical protein
MDLLGSNCFGDAETQPIIIEGRSLVAEGDDADVDADDDGDDDELTKRPSKLVRRPTHLSADNVIADCPMESDLDSNETVNELLNHVLNIQEDMLAMEVECGWEDVMPIMQDIPVALSCDGAPAYALLSQPTSLSTSRPTSLAVVNGPTGCSTAFQCGGSSDVLVCLAIGNVEACVDSNSVNNDPSRCGCC